MVTPIASTRRVAAGDLELTVIEAGPWAGPLALCLHGFVDTPHTWRHLLVPLSQAGFHVVMPFRRGYAPNPVSPGGDDLETLATDAEALHEAVGRGEPGVLVGHDEGAAVALATACRQPDRWSRVVALSWPPGASPATGEMSVSEATVGGHQRGGPVSALDGPGAVDRAAHDPDFVAQLWRTWSPGYAADRDVADAERALADPVRLAAAIRAYRRLPGLAPEAPPLSVGPQPTLLVHGSHDGATDVAAARAAALDLPDHARLVVLDGVGHAPQVEAPTTVATLVLTHLATDH